MKSNLIKLYTGISGQDVSVPMYEYGQGKPILYIQGGVHGGEVTYFILHKLAQYLTEIETNLKGKVTIVPLCNPVAWNQRMYYYTVGKFDLYKGKDWNRSYPGGETSLSARMSKKLFDIASQSSIVIDLHTARNSKPYGIFGSKKSEELIRILGLTYNYYIDFSTHTGQSFKGTLNDAVACKGILETTIECGSHDVYDAPAIREVYNSLRRVVSTYVLQQQIKKKRKKQFMFSAITTLHSPISGFAQYKLSPQTTCRAGERIASLYPSRSLHERVDFCAPFDGVLFELPKTTILWEGDELVKLIPTENIHTLM